ncbi:MAG: hypothetical protein AVDCRST_MAG21-935 [uncultured Nocardioidaceae bacterium]|uniref:Uncharacterized protein n=1 Tax=uncultured Nocardioidaceae bacterium TaxID=253824 RepID=A0A6J4N3X8_9ACTN|nr:MAG: hypothetical protein AVDCRST_MAG21-935 [uncultured Nocardioidaceae bacterium]
MSDRERVCRVVPIRAVGVPLVPARGYGGEKRPAWHHSRRVRRASEVIKTPDRSRLSVSL